MVGSIRSLRTRTGGATCLKIVGFFELALKSACARSRRGDDPLHGRRLIALSEKSGYEPREIVFERDRFPTHGGRGTGLKI
jgi:hypothetical protein